MGKVRDTSRSSRRTGGKEIMGKVTDTSRSSRRTDGKESHGKGDRH